MRFDVDAATVSVYEGSDAHNACLAAAEPSLTIATPATTRSFCCTNFRDGGREVL